MAFSDNHRGKRGAVRPLLMVFIGVVIFAAGIYASGFLRGGEKDSKSQTASLAGKTFTDVFGLGNPDQKPAAEVEIEGSGGEGAVSGKVIEDETTAPAPSEENHLGGGTNPTSQSSSDGVKAGLTDLDSTPNCVFSSGGEPSRQVLINEVDWMGSPARSGETASEASNNEWLELKNASAGKVGLNGWQILEKEGRIKIRFNQADELGAGAFYLVERTDDNSVSGIKADKIYSGSLSNSGAWLKLFDKSCSLVDEVNASAGWEGIGGDNSTKQTLERNANDFGWHTSTSAGGTPKAPNSAPPLTVSSP